MHTSTLARTHKHTHTHPRKFARLRMHTHTHTHACAQTHAHSHSHSHTHEHAESQKRARLSTHILCCIKIEDMRAHMHGQGASVMPPILGSSNNNDHQHSTAQHTQYTRMQTRTHMSIDSVCIMATPTRTHESTHIHTTHTHASSHTHEYMHARAHACSNHQGRGTHTPVGGFTVCSVSP